MSDIYLNDPMKDPKMAKFVSGLIKFTGFVIGITLMLSTGIKTITAGEIGVVRRFGAVTGRILHPGIHFIIPLAEGVTRLPTKKVVYETSPSEKMKDSEANFKDYLVDSNTSDGQSVHLAFSIRFSVDPTKGGWIVDNIGTIDDLVEKIVKAEARSWSRNILRNYSADTLYQGEGALHVQDELFDKLKPSFEANGLILDFVGVRELEFEKEYTDAIAQKQIQEVQVETQRHIAEQAKFKKEATITEAEAQAEQQRLQRETISPQILEKMWIEQWDGHLPTTILGNDATTLLQLPGK